MEQALRPRGQNTPDVIRSALDKNDSGLSTIDNLFGAPDKILIPERYIPDTVSTANIFNARPMLPIQQRKCSCNLQTLGQNDQSKKVCDLRRNLCK